MSRYNNKKRSTEWVDLTGSSPPPRAKHARVAQPITPPASSQPAPRQSLNPRDSFGVDNEEDEIIDLSQDADEGVGWVCVGVIDGKIVGTRYYTGYATPGEQVMVKREPSNQYDRNAIRINNVQGAQVGHLPRQLASKLAPYMVSYSLPHYLISTNTLQRIPKLLSSRG
jgi:SWI/SNF-related matrix-associated actin-dependent regulator of chromatin subfamily A3